MIAVHALSKVEVLEANAKQVRGLITSHSSSARRKESHECAIFWHGSLVICNVCLELSENIPRAGDAAAPKLFWPDAKAAEVPSFSVDAAPAVACQVTLKKAGCPPMQDRNEYLIFRNPKPWDLLLSHCKFPLFLAILFRWRGGSCSRSFFCICANSTLCQPQIIAFVQRPIVREKDCCGFAVANPKSPIERLQKNTCASGE